MARRSYAGENTNQRQWGVDTIPLVLHRVVKGASGIFEDIDEEIFSSIVRYISKNWVSFESSADFCPTDSWSWLLTFDDGHSSDFEVVFPVLQEAGVRAVFFLISEKVGTPGHLSWEQVREMRRYGMEFGSHSLTHAKLTMLEERETWEELIQSRQMIEDRLGEPVRAFSFPYGYYNPELVHLAHAAGYAACCVSDHGTVKLPAKVIPRNSINGAMRWAAVHRVLDPSPAVRASWVLEDWAKKCAKQVLGDTAYVRLRNAFTRSRRTT